MYNRTFEVLEITVNGENRYKKIIGKNLSEAEAKKLIKQQEKWENVVYDIRWEPLISNI
jgi:hypothetical protein